MIKGQSTAEALVSQKTTSFLGGMEPNISKTIEELSTAKEQKPNLVFAGCPHCSSNEIKQIAERI